MPIFPAPVEFSRLADDLIRLDRSLHQPGRDELTALAHGRGPAELAHDVRRATDPDAIRAAAELLAANEGGCGCSGDEPPAPTQSQIEDATSRLMAEARALFALNAALRERLLTLGVTVGGVLRQGA